MKTIQINTKTHTYPFIVGAGSIEQLHQYIGDATSKVLVITDDIIAKHHMGSMTAVLQEHRVAFDTFILPHGEEAKSLVWLERLLTKAIEAGLDRSSLMLAFGGGVVGDVAGFAAAIYMRGIPYIQVPTTVLAHDSSIGGKVAINHPLGKNMIGSFHQPRAIVYDTRFLLTLSDRDYAAGFAEMIKHAVIRDEALFAWMEEHTDRLLARDLPTLDEALYRSSLVKIHIVEEDVHEANVRALLNYGHTIGQAIENYFQYRWLHGEAIAIGMVTATHIAIQRLGYDVDLPRIIRLLERYQLPTKLHEHVDIEAVMAAARRDKKSRSGKIVMVFPERIGHAVIHHDVESAWIEEAIQAYIEE